MWISPIYKKSRSRSPKRVQNSRSRSRSRSRRRVQKSRSRSRSRSRSKSTCIIVSGHGATINEDKIDVPDNMFINYYCKKGHKLTLTTNDANQLLIDIRGRCGYKTRSIRHIQGRTTNIQETDYPNTEFSNMFFTGANTEYERLTFGLNAEIQVVGTRTILNIIKLNTALDIKNIYDNTNRDIDNYNLMKFLETMNMDEIGLYTYIINGRSSSPPILTLEDIVDYFRELYETKIDIHVIACRVN